MACYATVQEGQKGAGSGVNLLICGLPEISVYHLRLLDPVALRVELESLGIWPARPMECQ
jgi:hypothetical protein